MMICQLQNAFLMINLSGTFGFYFWAMEVISLLDAFLAVSHASDVAHLG